MVLIDVVVVVVAVVVLFFVVVVVLNQYIPHALYVYVCVNPKRSLTRFELRSGNLDRIIIPFIAVAV